MNGVVGVSSSHQSEGPRAVGGEDSSVVSAWRTRVVAERNLSIGDVFGSVSDATLYLFSFVVSVVDIFWSAILWMVSLVYPKVGVDYTPLQRRLWGEQNEPNAAGGGGEAEAVGALPSEVSAASRSVLSQASLEARTVTDLEGAIPRGLETVQVDMEVARLVEQIAHLSRARSEAQEVIRVAARTVEDRTAAQLAAQEAVQAASPESREASQRDLEVAQADLRTARESLEAAQEAFQAADLSVVQSLMRATFQAVAQSLDWREFQVVVRTVVQAVMQAMATVAPVEGGEDFPAFDMSVAVPRLPWG